jgi:hypothetical protein
MFIFKEDIILVLVALSFIWFTVCQFCREDRHEKKKTMLWHVGPLLSSDSVNSGRCKVTPATYTHVTI